MRKLIYILLGAVIGLSGCGNTGGNMTAQDGTLQVVTSFYPMYLLAQEALNDVEGITLTNMAQPETGCLHDYELTTKDMKTLEGADILIINGGGMEGFLEQAISRYPALHIIDTSSGVMPLEENDEGHVHEEAHVEVHEAHVQEHDHGANAHYWLSPANACIQVDSIASELATLMPEEAEQLGANAEAFRGQAEDLKEQMAGMQQEHVHVGIFHEGFAYLANEMGFHTVIGIFAEEYSAPSAKEVTEAIEMAKAEDVKLYLIADDIGAEYGALLMSEAGGQMVLLDPLTNIDKDGASYLERMEKNVSSIRLTLED